MSEFTVIPTTGYKIRFRDKDGSRKYHSAVTKAPIRRKLAWWIIVEKYGYLDSVESIGGLWCECGDYDCYGSPLGGCMIHDRSTGYFRRLHTRVTRLIAAGIMFPDSGLAE